MCRYPAGDRIKYLACKLRSLSGFIGNYNRFKSVALELHQLEVYRANALALRHYPYESLNGRLSAFEIFETANPRNARDWPWDGSAVRHHLPGRDSGDMLNGKNARVVATLLAARLREAFARESTKLDSKKVLESSHCGKRESFE
jgi:hypothetical protein